jgi:hypothetical protein
MLCFLQATLKKFLFVGSAKIAVQFSSASAATCCNQVSCCSAAQILG